MTSKTILNRLVAGCMAGALILTAPGLDCYQAVAATITGQAAPITAGSVVVVPFVVPAVAGQGVSARGSEFLSNAAGFSGSLVATRLPGNRTSVVNGSVLPGVYAPAAAREALPSLPAANGASRIGSIRPPAALPASAGETTPLAAQESLGVVQEKTASLGKTLSDPAAAPEAIHEAAAWEASRREESTLPVAAYEPMGPQVSSEGSASSAGGTQYSLSRATRRGSDIRVPVPGAAGSTLHKEGNRGLRPQTVGLAKNLLKMLLGAGLVALIPQCVSAAAGAVTTLSGLGTVVSVLTPVLPVLLAGGVVLVSEALRLFRNPSDAFRVLPSKEDRSPFKTWLPKVLLLTLGLVVLDWSSKYLAFLYLPSLFKFHFIPERTLLLQLGVPIAAGMVVFSRWGLGFVEKLAVRHPILKKALGMYDVVVAMAVAGILGNGLEALLFGKVADFIPFGRSTANIADLFIFFSMSYRMLAGDFFSAARNSDKGSEPITMAFWKYFAFPILAMLGAYFSFSKEGGIPTLGIYAFVYGLLFALGTLLSSVFVTEHIRSFNSRFHAVTQPISDFQLTDPAFNWFWSLRVKFLAVLAGLGFSVSAPSLSADQAKAILHRLAVSPPKLIVMDYDWTLQTNNGPRKGGTFVSPEMVQALEAAQKAGAILAISTDRPFSDPEDRPEDEKASVSHLLMNQLKPETRRNMLVGVEGGAEIYQYNGKGDKPKTPLVTVTPYSQAEQEGMSRIIQKAMADLDIQAGDIRSIVADYRAVLILEGESQRKKIESLGSRIEKSLRKEGLNYPLQVRYPKDPKQAPYIIIRKVDKSASIQGILRTLAEQGQYVDPSEVLLLGDESDRDGQDIAMANAVPQATMIAVGKRLDPRVFNAFLWPEFGPAGTLRVLKAIGEYYTERNPEHIFSYTQLQLRERSPREFKERYASGKRGEAYYKEALPIFVGQRVHETFHWLHLNIPGMDLTKPVQQQELFEKVREVYKKLWDLHWDSDRVDTDIVPPDGLPQELKDLETAKDRALRIKRYRDHGWAMIERYLKTYLPFSGDKTLALERRFFFRIQGPQRSYLFVGIPDRVAMSRDGVLEIHDFKSGKTSTMDEIRQNMQLALYAIGVRQAWPEYAKHRVRLVWHFPNTDLSWEPTEQELQAIELRAASISETILKDLSPDASVPTADSNGSDEKPVTLSAFPVVQEQVSEAMA